MASQFIIGKDQQSINRGLKPDGTEVHFLHFPEQIAAVTAGDTVHIVGRAGTTISALKGSGAYIVRIQADG